MTCPPGAPEPDRASASPVYFLWSTFTRFEPAADLHAARTEIVRHHLSYTAPIVIDARLKPGFPEELFCDERTADEVTRRWREYFPSDVEMGDSAAANLDVLPDKENREHGPSDSYPPHRRS